jgi:hypothetical protein
VAEAGDIRRTHTGAFEYLRSQRLTLRGGYEEVWELASEHAAKNMPLPGPFYANLRAHGFEGRNLYDLLIADGWTPPEAGYVEVTDGTRPVLDQPRDSGKPQIGP